MVYYFPFLFQNRNFVPTYIILRVIQKRVKLKEFYSWLKQLSLFFSLDLQSGIRHAVVDLQDQNIYTLNIGFIFKWLFNKFTLSCVTLKLNTLNIFDIIRKSTSKLYKILKKNYRN